MEREPTSKDIRQVFVDWVAFLREQKGFGPEDPLFPKSKVAPGEDLEFRAVAHWRGHRRQVDRN
jgi:hypothetical protein